MEKNSFIFSFKKRGWPLAVLIAVGMVISLEGVGFLVMRQVRQLCSGGDLARMDTDFFCSNFREDCLRDKPLTPEDHSPVYPSWSEAGKQGPYDLIITGTSVGNTGWAEKLRLKGWRVFNATANTSFRGFLPDGIYNFLNHVDEANATSNAMQLYVTLTDRGDLDFHNLDQIKPSKPSLKFGADSRFQVFWNYLMKKIELRKTPEVVFKSLGGEKIIFDLLSLEGTLKQNTYDSLDIERLSTALGSYQKDALAKGIRLVFISFPTKPQAYEWALFPERSVPLRPNREALREACARNGIPFLDIEKELEEKVRLEFSKNGQLLWFYCDTHMNELGAVYTAEIIDTFLKHYAEPK